MVNPNMTIEECKVRLTNAVEQFVLKSNTDNKSYVGAWKIESTDDWLMLRWECDAFDIQVKAMNPEFQGVGVFPDAPWTLWGGNEIIAVANIGDYNDMRSGCDVSQRSGIDIVMQYVTWEK